PRDPRSSAATKLMLLFLQRSRSNVFAIVRAGETNLSARLISAFYRGPQIRRACRHAEHAPARAVVSPVALRGPRMKHFHTRDRASFFETVNPLALLERARISSRRYHYAN